MRLRWRRIAFVQPESISSGALSRHTAGHNIAGYHYDPDRVIVELYTEMDQFIPELGFHEPRPLA